MRRNKNYIKERDLKRQKLGGHSFYQGSIGGGGVGRGGLDQGGARDGQDSASGGQDSARGGLDRASGGGYQSGGLDRCGARGGQDSARGGQGGGVGRGGFVQGSVGDVQGGAGSGQDSPRDGHDIPRRGQDSAKDGQDSSRGGQDSARGVQDSAKDGQDSSAKDGQDSARDGQGGARDGQDSAKDGQDSGRGGQGGGVGLGGVDLGGVGDCQDGGVDQSGGLGQGDGNQYGTMETEESHENHKHRLVNSERQLLLRCTLLEQQNRIIKTREQVTKSFLQSTLFRLHSLEHRLSQLEKLQKSGPISTLPEEMIFSIFRHLPLTDIISAQSTCRTWSRSIVAWLKVIDLSPFYNGVNNWTLKKISKFSNLQCLVLSRCKEIDNYGLTVVAESFPGLIRLDLFGCQANDFSALRGLRGLRALRVGDCKAIVDKDLEGLPPQLETLRVEWCPGIRAEGLTNLSNLTNLTSLHVGQCDFLRGWGFSLPGRVAQGLTELTVDRQPFFNDQALGLLRGCTSLRKLRFYWLPIQGTRVRALSSLERLEHLKLQRCHALTDDGLLAISTTLTNLKVLELRGESRVTNKGLQHLANLSFLRVLRLRCGKHVNDTGLQFLSHLSLTKLDLCDCVNITNETLLLIASTQCNTLRKLFFSQSVAISASAVSSFLSRLTNLVEFRLMDCVHVRDFNWNLSSANPCTNLLCPT